MSSPSLVVMMGFDATNLPNVLQMILSCPPAQLHELFMRTIRTYSITSALSLLQEFSGLYVDTIISPGHPPFLSSEDLTYHNTWWHADGTIWHILHGRLDLGPDALVMVTMVLRS